MEVCKCRNRQIIMAIIISVFILVLLGLLEKDTKDKSTYSYIYVTDLALDGDFDDFLILQLLIN